MAQFDRNLLEELRRQIDIVQVVERFLPLQKKGNDWLGLCPFHDDSKPSLHVNSSMGIYKCFACGAGGDVFRFVMEREQLEFPEAVEMIAEMAGFPLPQLQSGSPEEVVRREKLLLLRDLHHRAAQFFASELRTNSTAQEYLKNRHITGQTAKEFQIGWAPDQWDQLTNHFQKQGVNEQLLVESGLCNRRDSGGCYDRFRGRVIFPIESSVGQVIAFGGRTLNPDEPAKYLNSPESPLYHKSDELYGFSKGKEEIRRSQKVLVVEGYLDLLQLWQNGIRNVVAVSGTAFTPQQVELLKRSARHCTLIFDGDAAGRKAADRSIPLLLAQGIETRVLLLPEGEDPDSLVRDHGPDLFLKRIERESLDFVDFTLSEQSLHQTSSPEERAAVVDKLNGWMQMIPNPVVSEGYRQKISEKLQLHQRHIARGRSPSCTASRPPRLVPPPDGEALFVSTLLHSEPLREVASRTFQVDLLSDERVCEIVDQLILLQQQEQFDMMGLREGLSPEARDLLERLVMEEAALFHSLDESEMAQKSYLETLLKLEERAIKRRREEYRSSEESSDQLKWLEGNQLVRTIVQLHKESAKSDADHAALLEQYLHQLFTAVRQYLQ